MNISREFSDLLGALYASTANPSGWRSMARRFARSVGAHSCQISIWSPKPGGTQRLSWTDNYTPDVIRAYQAVYYKQDPWVAWVQRIVPGSLVTGDVTTIAPHFMRTEIYNNYCLRLGIFHVIGAGVERKPDGTYSIIGLHRDEKSGAFTNAHRHRLTSLLPHVRQALELRETIGHLNLERGALFSGLQSLQMGVAIVDMDGRLLFANATAEGLFRAQSPLAIRDGRVHLAESRKRHVLLKIINDAANAGSGKGYDAGGPLCVPLDAERKLWLRVCPLPESVFGESLRVPAAIVFLRHSDTKPLALQQWLIRLYGLTRAEARLAEALANGHSLAECSAQARVSINTTKTLSKRIYAKTGHHSRSKFIRDLLDNPFLGMDTQTAGSNSPDA